MFTPAAGILYSPVQLGPSLPPQLWFGAIAAPLAGAATAAGAAATHPCRTRLGPGNATCAPPATRWLVPCTPTTHTGPRHPVLLLLLLLVSAMLLRHGAVGCAQP